MVNIAFALDEFEITLIAYNPETQSAQIEIKNIGTKDYHDVTMALGNLDPVRIVGLLKQGNAIKVPKGIPPGKHTITISAEEGVTVAKEIDFPKSELQVKKEREIKKQIEEIEEKTQLRVYETKKKPIKKTLIIIGALVMFFFIVYFISRKRKRVT